MMTDSKLTNWVLIKDIALSLMMSNNGKASSVKIKEEFEKLYPERKSINVSADMNMLTVNSKSRLSYLHIYGKASKTGKIMNPSLKNRPFDEYPRQSSENNTKDIFYKCGRGLYERYNSRQHGIWYIRLNSDDVNHLSSLSEFEVKEKDFISEVSKSLELSPESRGELINPSNEVEYEIVKIKRIKRNPHIVAERLHRSGGKCDKCGMAAPFIRKTDGTPYLEVHHINLLSEGGKDILDNTVALCPNCHREYHFG